MTRHSPKSGIAERTYNVSPSYLDRALGTRRLESVRQRIGALPRMRARGTSLYVFKPELLRETYDLVRGCAERWKELGLKQNEWRAMRGAQQAIERAVDMDSRLSVLGVKPTLRGECRKLRPNEVVRVYVHTLDGIAAVFLGNRIEVAPANKTMQYETPQDHHQVRREQRAALTAHVQAGGDRRELEARLGWVSYKMTARVRAQSSQE